jgi:dihydrofolate synthase/folylpolyglutamate synthase
MENLSLDQWLHWLEKNHPVEIELGLDRVREVASRLGLLKPAAKVVTVAGTNGKGSCVTATAALLQAAGHQVGVYMSPHLHLYNERIRVNGVDASDDEICTAFNAIYHASQASSEYSSSVSLTYFEYGTLAALYVFRARDVSAIVLEVGLGGRLDAVNIIDADVAVITTIALDHTDWLGDTREKIGFEKAGIIRASAPVVCADRDIPQSVIDHAASLNAPLHCLGDAFEYVVKGEWWTFSLSGHAFPQAQIPQLPLPSVAAALYVIHLLSVPLAPHVALQEVAQLRMTGRFQRICYREREIILDVAHNPAATAYLAERLLQLPLSVKTYAIVAMMADKDRLATLNNLIPFIDEWNVASLEHLPRAASVESLCENLSLLGVNPVFTGDMATCLSQVVERSNKGDRILICGSFFTVGAALEYLDGAGNTHGLNQ